jgi:hypothetical protein
VGETAQLSCALTNRLQEIRLLHRWITKEIEAEREENAGA